MPDILSNRPLLGFRFALCRFAVCFRRISPHMESSSKKVIFAALTANLAIAVGKFATAMITGSSSMLAEGFHSTADTGNSLLLLLGVHRSNRPAEPLHPFGHGKELYFWSFVVAVSIFAVGGVLSIWEGIRHIQRPSLSGNLLWNYGVLAFGGIMDGFSLFVSLRQIVRTKGSASFWEFVRRSKDPTVYTIALEDSTDLIGLAIAFFAMFLGERLHMPWLDGLGSVAIGVLLISVSTILARESKNLLIGESATREQLDQIKRAVTSHPGVDAVGPILTMQLGPSSVLVNVDIRFKPQGSLQALESTIRAVEDRIRAIDPSFQHIFLEASSLQVQHRRAS